MKKIYIFVFLILLCLSLIFVFYNNNSFSFDRNEYSKGQIYIKDAIFDVFIADNKDLREKGLSGWTSLEENEGMLFVFESLGRYGFWMKDMRFALDIIWIGEDLKVKKIENSVAPETYPQVFESTDPVLYVLELPAGTSERWNLEVFDEVKIKML